MVRRYKGMIRTTVDADVEIGVDEVLEQISDEELLAEIKERKLEEKAKARAKMADPLEMLDEVIDTLRAGNVKDALLILERLAYPKFKSLELCEAEFAKLRSL